VDLARKEGLSLSLLSNAIANTSLKVIVECQKHQDYQESIRWLLDTIDGWARRARDVGKGAKEGEGLLPAGTLAQDPSLRSALELFRTLLERIANAPLEPIIAAARVLASDSANDEGLRKWWGDIDGYVRKVCFLFREL
jgi:hypothetical protein